MFAYIDSTSCQIERPSDKLIQGELYDGKHKFHSLKYECCVRSDGLFVWRSSPFPGKMHDIRVFNESGLLDKIRAGEMLIGDKGYAGHESIITPYKGRNISEDEKHFNRVIGSARVIIEHSFGRLKNFNILNHPFRNNLDDHQLFFEICVNLTNINIMFSPMFQ